MSLKHKKTFAIILLSSFIMGMFYFVNIPLTKAADGGAGWAQFWQTNLKEFVLDTIARLLSRFRLSDYLNNMVNQINTSGRTGRSPSFVTNWRNFLTEAQYRGEDVFRTVLGNTVLCPQNGDIRTIFRAPNTPTIITQNTRTNNLDPFTRRARCTMPRDWSIEQFNRSFTNNGGWEAIMRLAEPQNNFLGALVMSSGELAAQRAVEAVSDSSETQAGKGFTGTRSRCTGGGNNGICSSTSGQVYACVSGGAACTPDTNGNSSSCPAPFQACVSTAGGRSCSNDPRRACQSNSDCVVLNSAARCTFMGEVLTPGDVLGQSASNYIDKNIGWLISSDELSEVLLNMVSAIVNKMVNFRGSNGPGVNAPDAGTAYNTCTRTCGGMSGDNYRDCLNNCASDAGQTQPSDFNFSDPRSPTPAPGVCSDTSNSTARYQSALGSAINTVNSTNPNGIADQLNTEENAFTYLNFVAAELQNNGYQATTNVLNGNGNPNHGDLIAIWMSGDTLADRYDAIVNVGGGDRTLRSAAGSGGFVGQISIASCITNGGGGGSGGNNLLSGQSLSPGQAIHSPNGRYSFDLDTVGNLILYDTNTSPAVVLWTSGTSGATSLEMQTDGDLVLHGTSWSTGTSGNAGAVLDLSDGGNLVIYSGIGGSGIYTIY